MKKYSNDPNAFCSELKYLIKKLLIKNQNERISYPEFFDHVNKQLKPQWESYRDQFKNILNEKEKKFEQNNEYNFEYDENSSKFYHFIEIPTNLQNIPEKSKLNLSAVSSFKSSNIRNSNSIHQYNKLSNHSKLHTMINEKQSNKSFFDDSNLLIIQSDNINFNGKEKKNNNDRINEISMDNKITQRNNISQISKINNNALSSTKSSISIIEEKNLNGYVNNKSKDIVNNPMNNQKIETLMKSISENHISYPRKTSLNSQSSDVSDTDISKEIFIDPEYLNNSGNYQDRKSLKLDFPHKPKFIHPFNEEIYDILMCAYSIKLIAEKYISVDSTTAVTLYLKSLLLYQYSIDIFRNSTNIFEQFENKALKELFLLIQWAYDQYDKILNSTDNLSLDENKTCEIVEYVIWKEAILLVNITY